MAPADRHGPVSRIEAAVFDTDGVITRTATVHAAAWKSVFDEFLRRRAETAGQPLVPFSDDDYRRYVDGLARYDGVKRFLSARGIELPPGRSGDPPGFDTVHALGNRKNGAFLAELAEHGVERFESTVVLIRRLRELGVGTAAVSASENCAEVLAAAEVDDLFDARVDGLDVAALDLPGKPDPALFLEAAKRLGVPAGRTAVFEDALAGVEAGRRGAFGLVVGIDRTHHGADLLRAGADVVVTDLACFHVDDDRRWSVDA